MSIHPAAGDPTVIPQLVAEHIANSGFVNDASVTAEHLTEAIAEVTPQTQTLGAALLQVTLIDPDWKIARSGICDQDADGFLPPVDVNFPEGTNVWWRLAMVDLQSVDAAQAGPNLTLTFQHRIVSYLIDCWGPLGWPGGKAGTTRAQFIKMLIDRMPKELPKQSVGPGAPPSDFTFICPELNELQPVAQAVSLGSQVVLPGQSQSLSAKINKGSGLTAATKITIKGVKPTAQQIRDLNTALGVAASLKAPPVAVEALIFAGIAETGFTEVTNSSGHKGIWQSTYYAQDDVVGAATGFLNGGPSFQGGGAIKLARTMTDPVAIAEAVEAGGSYAGEAGYANFLPEAKAIIAAYGGGGILASLSTASANSDVAQLTRGTPANQDEDSWTCGQRLASEMNWVLFTSPSPAPGVWGNYIYYIDKPTLVEQRPSLYLELSQDGTTWKATGPSGKVIAADGVVSSLRSVTDNTAMLYQETRKVKGRVQRKTKIRTPQTPSQVQFNMVCGALEFNAGDVFVFHNAGPLKGRWIVEDVTHNTLEDLFAQFTLGPPTYPYPEPQGTSTISTNSPNVPTLPSGPVSQGVLSGVAQAALAALAAQQKSHVYQYAEIRPFPTNDLFQPAAGPRVMDCSQFATLCYKAAGLPDPNHLGYSGYGNTSSLIAHCQKISAGDARPGDLCFFGSSVGATAHVNVYVGNGKSVSMGTQGDPSEGPAAAMGPAGFLGYFRSDVAGSQPSTQTGSTSSSPSIAPNTNPIVPQGVAPGIFTPVFSPNGNPLG